MKYATPIEQRPQPGDKLMVRYDGYDRVDCEVVKCDGTWTDIIWLFDSRDGDRYKGMEIRALTEKLYKEGDDTPLTAMQDLAIGLGYLVSEGV